MFRNWNGITRYANSFVLFLFAFGPSFSALALTPALESSSHPMASPYSLGADPQQWGLSLDLVEPDDELHTPKKTSGTRVEHGGTPISVRGFSNLGCLIVLCFLILALFLGYPVISYATRPALSTHGGFNIGGLNASGQVPSMAGNWGLIDVETPKEAYTVSSWRDSSKKMQLVFSDEFNTDGRTFYPGDDPYWEAATNNMEWYDPAAVMTANGSLVITLEEKETHDLHYQGGKNKFCFTGGYIETSVELPGANNILGLWPAVWTMGNLGRAGYGASLEGTWPYTYDFCDVGTVANQSVNGQPVAATVNGDTSNGGILSFLPGQRLSRCTCRGESHPGPIHSDGTYVNEHTFLPGVSQSAQWAPFNQAYDWNNSTQNFILQDPSLSVLNVFKGSVTQQATSVVTNTNGKCYEKEQGCYSVYGFEAGFDDGYITWISEGKMAWTMNSAGMGPDPSVAISTRPIPTEPMYIIANLGMSRNFGPVDIAHLGFPVHMRIDYIRVYQDEDDINYGCDPKDFPTQAYIEKYIEAYTNPNLTTWAHDYGQPVPRNSFLGQC
ncbi:beta-glucan synthesis-associated [Mycena floridula]|nr:beta-glucan synthesis-associated [Mycena floridula]